MGRVFGVDGAQFSLSYDRYDDTHRYPGSWGWPVSKLMLDRDLGVLDGDGSSWSLDERSSGPNGEADGASVDIAA